MGVSARLIEIKKHFGWNNVELAKAAGVTKQAVNAWLNRDVTPGYDPVMRLRDKYGINDAWLLHGNGEMLSSRSMDDELRSVFQALQESDDPEIKESFLRIARALLEK